MRKIEYIANILQHAIPSAPSVILTPKPNTTPAHTSPALVPEPLPVP